MSFLVSLKAIALAFSVVVIWYAYDPSADACSSRILRDVGHCLLDRAINDAEPFITGETPNEKQSQIKEEAL